MDIYARKSRLKIYLAILGLLIVAASMVFTYYLANKLRTEEVKRVQQYRLALNLITSSQPTEGDNPDNATVCDVDYTLHQKILEDNTTIPVVLLDDRNNIISFNNFDTEDTVQIRGTVNKMIAQGDTALQIESVHQRLYFKNSKILTLLTYFPFIQFLLIAGFMAFGYWAFSSARRSEQNQVWVGMAKETAHQLGTPISAIVAWIDYLRIAHAEDDATLGILHELDTDVNRLGLVADRFSKIGSAPELEAEPVAVALDRCREYMQKRSPRKVQFHFPALDDATLDGLSVKINAHLFDWVVENILRNAIDAMDGVGAITATVYADSFDWVSIEISDTGKGIPKDKFKTVFRPGYTTKKRGWGLGLSLAKRIIEQYHAGKIFVKKSVPNEATVFCIKLPRAK
jgi:signal transduction histidine kinase